MIDSHVHLDSSDFDADRTEVLDRSRAAGVTEWIVPATTVASARALRTAAWKTAHVHVAAGIHPQEIRSSTPADLDELERLLESAPDIVAVGETGIDYHYEPELRDRQLESFDRHLHLAARFDLPVIVHARDGNGLSAYADILDRARNSKARGVLHSFTGDAAVAARAVDLGWHIGLGGIMTFKKSDALREVVQHLPLDRIVLETDAPYLAPVPNRGKRNEPAWLLETLKIMAGFLGKSAGDLALLITSTTRSLFPLTRTERSRI